MLVDSDAVLVENVRLELNRVKRQLQIWRSARWIGLIIAGGAFVAGVYYSFAIPDSFKTMFAKKPDLAKELWPVFASGIDRANVAAIFGLLCLCFIFGNWNGTRAQRLMLSVAEVIVSKGDSRSK